MSSNGFFKNKGKLSKNIHKAILATVGVTTSKELIKKTATNLFDDIQGLFGNLLEELKDRGEIKTKQAKKIIKELQSNSEVEKEEAYKQLKKSTDRLVKKARELIVTPIVLASKFAKTVKGLRKNLKTTTKKKSVKKSKRRK